jgi:hypothetical protein
VREHDDPMQISVALEKLLAAPDLGESFVV